MFKSVTRVVSRTSNRSQRHGYRARTPKTRFSVKDRSVSSPRLKSFPAEKIRRIERSPIRKTPEIADSPNRQIIHSGQGDVSANFQNTQLLRSSPIGNGNITSTSEQQVSQNVCTIDDRLNQSELVIPSRGVESTAIERPQHRPHVQQPSTQQQPHHQREIAGQTVQQRTNNARVDIEQDKQFQSSLRGNLNQHGISSESSPIIQQQQPLQYHHRQNEISGQMLPQSLNAVKLENKQKIDGAKKKPLKFTPAMIRDQEVLVMTMRQQGIKEDIMRRQFDALLAEQRKQLLYLEQLENPETDETGKTPQARRVKRRITRIDEDGKPEWMLHITPPRIPYSVLEKMQAERQAEFQGTMGNNPGVLDTSGGQQSDNQRNEMYDRSSHACHQHAWRTNAPNGCPHHPQYSHLPNNMNAPGDNQSSNAPQYQPRCDGYVVHHQQPSYNPNKEQQILSDTCQMHRNELKQHEEHGRSNKTVEPSSLLKLRIYKEVIKRQKQNNGLQDPETIKEAMEALKNPANRAGLEYLENLNKKRDKPVLLNGVQDPNEIPASNQIPSYVCHQPMPRGPSSNGLENTRNPNNPPPRNTSRPKKMDDFNLSEYPRQRATNHSRNCYSLMAERENGTVAMLKNHQAQNAHGTSENQISCFDNSQFRSDNPNHQHSGYVQPAVRYDTKSPANYGTAASLTIPPNAQARYYPQHMQGRCENMEKIRNRIDAEMSQDRTMCKQAFPIEDKSNKNQQQDLYDPRKNYGIYEPVMIGGLKYLARKPQYCQNGASQHYQGNLGKSFNPMIACQ